MGSFGMDIEFESKYGTENWWLINESTWGTLYRQVSVSRVYRTHPINGDLCLIEINYHNPSNSPSRLGWAPRPKGQPTISLANNKDQWVCNLKILCLRKYLLWWEYRTLENFLITEIFSLRVYRSSVLALKLTERSRSLRGVNISIVNDPNGSTTGNPSLLPEIMLNKGQINM